MYLYNCNFILFVMDNIKIKTVGTREEVYKGIAQRTAGSLKKDDIIEKVFGNRTLYISKKISNKMKENINILRTQNPNFFKNIQKKTMGINPVILVTLHIYTGAQPLRLHLAFGYPVLSFSDKPTG